MPPRRVPASVCREINGVREWLMERQEAARQHDDQAQAQAQTATLEQLLARLNKMANHPPPPPVPMAPAEQNLLLLCSQLPKQPTW